MATALVIDRPSSSDVHQLPCSVQHDGPARVSAYFTPSIQETGQSQDGVEVLQAAFRGRTLQGAKVPLPPGYSGLVLAQQQQEPGDGGPASVSWVAQESFQAIHHWNHDSAPQRGDPLRRCLDWAVLAQALHAPVALVDVEVALAGSSSGDGTADTDKATQCR